MKYFRNILLYNYFTQMNNYTLEELNPDAFKRPIYLFKGNVTFEHYPQYCSI